MKLKYHELRAKFAAKYPQAFSGFRPLKIGVHKDVAGFSARETALFFGLYMARNGYLASLIEGAARIDLAGKPVGVVTADEAQHAAAKLAEQVAAFQEKLAAKTPTKNSCCDVAKAKQKEIAAETKRKSPLVVVVKRRTLVDKRSALERTTNARN